MTSLSIRAILASFATLAILLSVSPLSALAQYGENNGGGGGGGSSSTRRTSSGGTPNAGNSNCTPPVLDQIFPTKNAVLNNLNEVSFEVSRDAREDKISLEVDGEPMSTDISQKGDGTYVVSTDVSDLNLEGRVQINILAESFCKKNASYFVTVDPEAEEEQTDPGTEADFERGPDGTLFSNGRQIDALSVLSQTGIVRGEANGQNMNPTGSLNRAQAATMIIRALGRDENAPVSGQMPLDLESEEWYTSTIKQTVDLGIIQGFDDGTIRPSNRIRFEEAVTMLYRATGRSISDSAELPDGVNAGAWYSDAIASAYTDGLLDGVSIRVGRSINRGDFARLLGNFFGLFPTE